MEDRKLDRALQEMRRKTAQGHILDTGYVVGVDRVGFSVISK